MSCPDTCVIQITFLFNSAIRYGPKRDEAKRYIVKGQTYSLDWVTKLFGSMGHVTGERKGITLWQH